MKIADCTVFRHKECEISAEKWTQFTRWKQTEEWLTDETFRNHWHSFDCLHYNPQDGLVYAGLTATNGDFFYAFDPRSGTFESLAFPTEGDRYAHKIHFGLAQDSHGCYYGAVATLSDVDAWPHAPGGQIFRFDPRGRTFTLLGIPLPHDYIQGIVLDEQRGRLYGNTFPGRCLFCYELASGQTRILTHFGATLSEAILMDPAGGIWHNYHLAQWAQRTPLLRYDPGADRIDFLNLDLPNTRQNGSSTIDSALCTADGALYIGGTDGALSRLHPGGPAVEYLGKPLPGIRMKGLLEGPQGLILGVGGSQYNTFLFTYDRSRGAFDVLGPVQDSRDGTRAWIVHDLCLVDEHTLIAAETDNPQRASCLFRITLTA